MTAGHQDGRGTAARETQADDNPAEEDQGAPGTADRSTPEMTAPAPRPTTAAIEPASGHSWEAFLPVLILVTPLLALTLLAAAPAEVTPVSWALVGGLCVGAAAAGRAWTTGRPVAGARIFSGSLLGASLLALYLYGGIESASSVSVVTAVAVAGALLGRRALVLSALTALSAVITVARLASLGLMPRGAPPSIALSAATVLGNLILMCVVGLLGQRVLSRATHAAIAARQRDPVTGLLGKEGLGPALSGAMNDARDRGEPVALALIEIERFDLVRQSHGRGVTDPLLMDFTSRLRATLRGQTTIARLDGGDFAVVVEGASTVDELDAVGLRMKAALDRPVEVGEQQLPVSTRVGLAPLQDSHTSADRWLSDASVALASARDDGWGLVRVFEPAHRLRARRSLEIDVGLQAALEAGDLLPFYQPIMHLESNTLAGFEALVRWRQPDGRFVPPEEFLPRAEETGLLVDIDRAIMRQACEQLAEWRTRHPDSPAWVSVNMSARQFQAEGLVETVRDVLAATGLPPDRLHLELTETALTVDVKKTQRLLGELKQLGVLLLIDDFGTGWSSLSYVQSYPVDGVKIDRSFVQTIDEEGGHALAATIKFMANALHIEVVAEGIETRTQCQRLCEMGVEMGQGYHFSRAVPGLGAERFLRARTHGGPSGD